jgi:hypothetical protein
MAARCLPFDYVFCNRCLIATLQSRIVRGLSAIEKLASGLLVIRTEFGDRSQWRDDPGIRGGHRLLQSQWHPVMMTVSFWTSVPISSSCVIPSQVD